jgi:hypothetical protein
MFQEIRQALCMPVSHNHHNSPIRKILMNSQVKDEKAKNKIPKWLLYEEEPPYCRAPGLSWGSAPESHPGFFFSSLYLAPGT